MTETIANDRTQQIALRALDGLARQSELIGNNLANVDTPGYQARTIDFQGALEQALHGSKGIRLATTDPSHLPAPADVGSFQVSLRQGGSQRADGNNVDIDQELSDLTETDVNYQAITQLVSKKLLLLKTLATSR
jgi:flagellar basal-body rod protein FlgB